MFYGERTHTRARYISALRGVMVKLVDLGLSSPHTSIARPARVLVCGDADFDYTKALTQRLREVEVWTSCFEREDDLLERYPHAAPSIDSLRQDARVRVRFGVDARRIAQHFKGCTFDRIVFNLPQAPVVPGARNKIQRHRRLLSDVCASAESALAANGQLWITLLAGQGGTSLDPIARPAGDTWQLQHAGANANLLLRAVSHVDVDSLGYTPTGRRSNQRLTPSRLANGLVVHVLSREGEPAEPAVCGPLEWHFHNTFQVAAPVEPPNTLPLLEWTREALGSTCAHALVNPPVLLRARRLDDGRDAFTYRFIYRSARVALSRERIAAANGRACETIAHRAGLQWSLGYPVKPSSDDKF